jgi:hypothetical protein
MEGSTRFTRDWRIKIGTLAMALAIVGTAVTARPARADEHEHHDRHWRVQRHYRHPRRYHRDVFYAPAPDVYYAPPPVVYVPPPPPRGFGFIFPFTIR